MDLKQRPWARSSEPIDPPNPQTSLGLAKRPGFVSSTFQGPPVIESPRLQSPRRIFREKERGNRNLGVKEVRRDFKGNSWPEPDS
jgi:hypothetical protein